MWEIPEINLSQIDLRHEYKSVEKEFGFKVLLVRANSPTKCRCYDPLHGDGNRKCKICGGTGNVNIIEKIDVIHENINTEGFVKMTELGLTVSNTVILYMSNKVFPKVRDKVFIVGYDKFGIPVDIKKDCTVVSVEEIRGEVGRVECYKVFARYSPDQILIDQRRLNAIPGEQKSEIMKGKRYTWPVS